MTLTLHGFPQIVPSHSQDSHTRFTPLSKTTVNPKSRYRDLLSLLSVVRFGVLLAALLVFIHLSKCRIRSYTRKSKRRYPVTISSSAEAEEDVVSKSAQELDNVWSSTSSLSLANAESPFVLTRGRLFTAGSPSVVLFPAVCSSSSSFG